MKKLNQIPTLEQVKKELAKRNFYYFVKEFWGEVDPDDFVDAWYVECICDHLQAIYEGDLKNLVINIPPGMGKSLLCSVLFMGWTWINDPSFNMLCSTKAAGNLKRDAFKFYNLIMSKKFQAWYGDLFSVGSSLKSSDDGRQKISEDFKEIQNNKKGYRRAITTGSTTTGARGKIILLDDPNDRSEIHSKQKRDTTNDYVFNTLSTRNFAKRGGAMIIVMQRLHDEDVAGVALTKGFSHLKIPMENEGTSVFALKKWKEKRKLGEYIAPALFDKTSKEAMLKMMTKLEYVGQYQQEPAVQGGNIIKGSDLIRYKILPKLRFRKIFADTAQKTKEHNDYSVFECWGEGDDGKLYLVDLIRGRWEAPELKRRAKAFWAKHANQDTWAPEQYGSLRQMLVEDKSSGTGLIQDISAEASIPIKGIPRNVDKMFRCNDSLPYIEAGLVCIPESAPFTNDFVAECEAFTADDSHSFDDQLDPMFDAIEDMLSTKSTTKKWARLAE